MIVSLAPTGGQVVHQQHGQAAPGEELLERKHLAAIAQGILGQQAHLRQAVEHQAARLEFVDAGLDQLDGVTQFGLPGMQDGLLLRTAEHGIGGGQFEQVHAVQAPAVGLGHAPQLFAGLRQGDVEHRLALADAFEEKLQAQGRLARTWGALQQVEPILG